jgi:transcriptional regulator with XRE-family HTH domain
MSERERRDVLVSRPSGRRRPPKPPVRVGGGLKELPSDELPGSRYGRGGHLSKEHIRQIERGITWPTLNALHKIAAALKRSGSAGGPKLDRDRSPEE